MVLCVLERCLTSLRIDFNLPDVIEINVILGILGVLCAYLVLGVYLSIENRNNIYLKLIFFGVDSFVMLYLELYLRFSFSFLCKGLLFEPIFHRY